MNGTNPMGYYCKWANWLCLNHSRCPASYRNGVVDLSVESYDPPLQEEPTLPLLGLPTVNGTPPKVGQTLDFSPSREFSQSARPLARLGFGGVSVFLEAFFFLFPMTPTPFTSSNSFPRYSTLHPPS